MSAASAAEGFRLFRPEALEAQRQALLGRILINTPLAHWLLAATAAALVAALFTFLWFAQRFPLHVIKRCWRQCNASSRRMRRTSSRVESGRARRQ